MSENQEHKDAENEVRPDEVVNAAISTVEKVSKQVEANAEPKEVKAGGGETTADQFAGLPIESLICKPIIAAAQGQQELTAIYIDTVKKLAYQDGSSGTTNELSFNLQRPVIGPDGSVTKQSYTVEAPLLSLVPIPAFLMDDLTVDFEMEVKDSTLSDDKTHKDASSTVKYNSWWGLDAQITGNISSDSEHKRTTDNSATYKIHARAIQQSPSEGMEKLTSLLSQGMEPIKVK